MHIDCSIICLTHNICLKELFPVIALNLIPRSGNISYIFNKIYVAALLLNKKKAEHIPFY